VSVVNLNVLIICLWGCAFYGSIWEHIWRWIDIQAADRLPVFDHLHQFIYLVGDFKKLCSALHVIWLSSVWTIWKDKNSCIFRHIDQSLQQLMDNMKLSSFRWLQVSISNSTFDFHHWWTNPIQCFIMIPN
jgi:hypothetical protein